MAFQREISHRKRESWSHCRNSFPIRKWMENTWQHRCSSVLWRNNRLLIDKWKTSFVVALVLWRDELCKNPNSSGNTTKWANLVLWWIRKWKYEHGGLFCAIVFRRNTKMWCFHSFSARSFLSFLNLCQVNFRMAYCNNSNWFWHHKLTSLF